MLDLKAKDLIGHLWVSLIIDQSEYLVWEKLRHQLRHPGRVLDLKANDLIGHLWVSLIIDQSEYLVCYFFLQWINSFLHCLRKKNCSALNKSEWRNVFMYIIRMRTQLQTAEIYRISLHSTAQCRYIRISPTLHRDRQFESQTRRNIWGKLTCSFDDRLWFIIYSNTFLPENSMVSDMRPNNFHIYSHFNLPWLKKIIWVIGVLRRTVVNSGVNYN